MKYLYTIPIFLYVFTSNLYASNNYYKSPSDIYINRVYKTKKALDSCKVAGWQVALNIYTVNDSGKKIKNLGRVIAGRISNPYKRTAEKNSTVSISKNNKNYSIFYYLWSSKSKDSKRWKIIVSNRDKKISKIEINLSKIVWIDICKSKSGDFYYKEDNSTKYNKGLYLYDNKYIYFPKELEESLISIKDMDEYIIYLNEIPKKEKKNKSDINAENNSTVNFKDMKKGRKENENKDNSDFIEEPNYKEMGTFGPPPSF